MFADSETSKAVINDNINNTMSRNNEMLKLLVEHEITPFYLMSFKFEFFYYNFAIMRFFNILPLNK